MKISLGVSIGSFVSHTKSMDVAEAIFHSSAVSTLVSHYFVFQFIRI